jgi:hypothetical protein
MVNFPVDSVKSSGEGGMIVRLWAEMGFEDEMCCGHTFRETISVCVVGEHTLITPTLDCYTNEPGWLYELEEREPLPWENPNQTAFKTSQWCEFSPSLVASVTLGATGWSGSYYSSDGSEMEIPGRAKDFVYWVCHFDDLTQEGKDVVHLMQRLYPMAVIRIVTFLDT